MTAGALGVHDHQLARRAKIIARLSWEELQHYLATANPPTVSNAIQFVGPPKLAEPRLYWNTPAEKWEEFEDEVGPLNDVCPPDRGDFDGLKVPWDLVRMNYANCVFQDLGAWVEGHRGTGRRRILGVPDTRNIGNQ